MQPTSSHDMNSLTNSQPYDSSSEDKEQIENTTTDSKKKSWPYFLALCNYFIACLCFFFFFGLGAFMFTTPSVASGSSPLSSMSSFLGFWLMIAPIINLVIIFSTMKASPTKELYKILLFTFAISVGITTVLFCTILATFQFLLSNFYFGHILMSLNVIVPQACIVVPLILVYTKKNKQKYSDISIKFLRVLTLVLSIADVVIVAIGFLSTIG